MGDRHDIDALLIGALYGELEGAEGADTAVWLATEPPGSGGFYRERQPARW